MKARLFILLLAILALCNVASAQSYSIRVAFNTVLRASYSLDSAALSLARAGTTLQVVGQHDRWLLVQRDGREYWMASWVRYERLETSAPAQPQPSNIDNCCFVDRQCSSDQQWTDGYWAFQNGQCAAPAQTQPQTSTQPVTVAIPTGVDNCCQVNRQCHSDDDWVRGYHDFHDNQCEGAPPPSTAPVSGPFPEGVDNCCRVNQQCHSDEDWTRGWLAFQHFQCNVPPATQGVNIQGSPAFVSQVRNAFALLRDRAPQWWKYSTTGLNTMKMIPEGGISGVYTHTKTYEDTLSEALKFGTGEAGLVYVIYGIVHEACHVHEEHRFVGKGTLAEEKACMEASLHALETVNPAHRGTIEWIRWVIANIYDPDVQWWH